MQKGMLVAIVGLLAGGCTDGTSPQSAPLQRVAVAGVSLDSAAFRRDGTFALGLVPLGADGGALLGKGVQIGAATATTATRTPALSVAFVSTTAQTAGAQPIAAALNIDDSGSMSSSDPQQLRRAAARSFWNAILGARSGNQVALADFGHGATRGFGSTRLLQGWGRDTTLLRQRLDSMTASGGTPLYESALEMLRWIDTTRTAGSYERVMLLMTDGQPNSDTYRDSVTALARRRGVTIHTVGLGDASDLAATRSTPAVQRVRDLAFRTGGVYAAAASPAALDTIFQTIATASSVGQLLATFRVTPIPASGTIVTGTVSVTSGGITKDATWALLAP